MRPADMMLNSLRRSLARKRPCPWAEARRPGYSGRPSTAGAAGRAETSPTGSVDREEVRKFEQYGAGWWDDRPGQGGAGPLHSMNPVRVHYIAKKRAGGLVGARVLDVGCGGGLLSEGLARLGAEVTGIDPVLKNIEVARTHAAVDPATAGIRYEHVTAEEMQATGERFDVVVSSEVVEHVQQPEQFMGVLGGLVAPGGDLVMSTINRTVKSYLLTIVMAEHVAKIIPPGTHDWKKFLQPQELARMVRKGGLEVGDVTGLVYNPIKDSWSLNGDDIDVNYILHAKRK